MFWSGLISHKRLIKKITMGEQQTNMGMTQKMALSSSQKANVLWCITTLIYKNDNNDKWAFWSPLHTAHTAVTCHSDKLMGLASLSSCQQCLLPRPSIGPFITLPSTRGLCKSKLQVTSLVKPLSTAGFSFRSTFSFSQPFHSHI